MWNLSEEKVEELERLMAAKKKEHDALQARHIHELWAQDLDVLLETLDKVEEKEEADRLAHGGVKNEGQKKGRKKKAAPARKLAKDKENNNNNEPTKKAPRKPAAKKPAKEKEEPAEPTLRERLAARGGQKD